MIRLCAIVDSVLAAMSPAKAQTLAATCGEALLQCYASNSGRPACLGGAAEVRLARENDGQRVEALLLAKRAWSALRDAESAIELAALGEGSIRPVLGRTV